MKLKERIALIKAGYSKKEIEEMITAEASEQEEKQDTEEKNENEKETASEEPTEAEKQIEELKKQIELLQKGNIDNDENHAPKKVTSEDAWKSFFGEKEK